MSTKKNTTKILLLLVFLAGVITGKAQSLNEASTNKNNPLYFYGIDFTKAVLIGDAEANAQDIVGRQFTGINNLLLSEASKYDVAGAFRRNEMNTDLEFVNKRNEKADPDKLLSSNTEDFNKLNEADIAALVKNFDVGSKNGTGILFVVDGMSKPGKAISVWVTLFNIQSKKILLIDKITGQVGMGFSFRNYWATGIKSVIDQIKNAKYTAWKSK